MHWAEGASGDVQLSTHSRGYKAAQDMQVSFNSLQEVIRSRFEQHL